MQSKALLAATGSLLLSILSSCAQTDMNNATGRTNPAGSAAGQNSQDARGKVTHCNSTSSGACASSGKMAAQDDRGAPPPVEDRRKIVMPKAEFNREDYSRDKLGRGHSVITGYACANQQHAGGMGAGGGFLYARNTEVRLLPYSDYLMERSS